MERLASVLFEQHCPTFSALAATAAVDRSHAYTLLDDPHACAYLCERGRKFAEAALGSVHARLTELALTSRSPAAIELFLKRFDPDFKTDKPAAVTVNGTNVLIQQVSSMSDAELEAFLNHKKQQHGHGQPSANERPAASNH